MDTEHEEPVQAPQQCPEATHGSPVPEHSGNAKSLKRKQSPSPEPDESSKKRRLSIDGAAEAPSPTSQSNGASASPTRETREIAGTEASSTTDRPPSPQARRPSKPIDERKRGQRLFGAAFAALGVNSSTNLSKRREIERKQREKLRAQAEEDDAVREERLARLRGVRMKEQRRFDVESTRIRHANMRAVAHSLRTKAEPRLYWRPWELRPEEEDIIKEQVQEAEDTITEETVATERTNGKDDEMVQGDNNHSARPEPDEDDAKMDDAGGERPSKQDGPDEAKQDEAQDGLDAQDESAVEEVDVSASKPEAGKPESPPDAEIDAVDARKDDMDEGAEDEHGDDAVIY